MIFELFGVNIFGYLGGMDLLFERDLQLIFIYEEINELQIYKILIY